MGVCAGNCVASSGGVQIAHEGIVSCQFDGTTTPGHFVQTSVNVSTVAECHDAGSSYPSSNQILGRVLAGGTGGGLYTMIFYPAEIDTVACASCVTGSSLTNNALVLGSGSQGTQTSLNFNVSGAQLNLGQASTATGTVGIYGSGSATPYTLTTNAGATALTTSGSLTVGSTGTGSHLQTNSTGNDIAGVAVLSSGSISVNVPFNISYTSKPVCVVTPESDATPKFEFWYVTPAAGSLTITTHIAPTANVNFDYVCIGNPN